MEYKTIQKRSLWVGASLLGLTAALPANAQTGEQAAETMARQPIIVTATRRATDVQDVPIAITAIDAVQLDRAGVADITSLDTIAPSFNLNTTGTQTGGITLRLRGVGTTGNNTGLESSVGVFLDGVYLSRPSVALGDLLDVERIEVLRGPQGTLFGRNTSAGALDIKTRRPDLNEFEGFANLTFGNYDLFNVQAGFNAPLVEDAVALRLSGAVRQRDGFVEGPTGVDSHSIDRVVLRGQLLLDFGAGGDIRIIADYAEGDDECCHAVWFRDSPTVNFPAFGLPADGGAPNIPGGDLDDYDSNDGQFDNPFEQFGISLEYNVDTPIGELTYIGSYRDFEARTARGADFTQLRIFTVGASDEAIALGGQNFEPQNNPTRIETMTHELRLQDTAFNGVLDWLIGFYYSHEDIEEQTSLTLLDQYQSGVSGGLLGALPLQPNPLFLTAGGVDATGDFASNRFDQTSESFSIFTHNVISLTDDFDITLGLRYVDESKDGSYVQVAGEHDACVGTLSAGAGNFLGPTGIALNCFIFAAPSLTRLAAIDPALAANPLAQALLPRHFSDTFEDDELVYTIKATYRPTPDITLYGGFTHGFKSGGFNLDASAAVGGADPRFASESVDAFEIGLRTEFWDGRARVNITGFHQEMSDFQVLEFTGVRFQTFNVDEALSTGVELEAQAQFTDSFSGNLSVTYADARYPSDCATQDPADPAFNATAATLCGNSLTNAPEWVVIGGATYEQPVFSGNADFFLTGSVRYESERRTSSVPTEVLRPDLPLPGDFQDDNVKVNLRLGLQAANESWAVELWGNNIFDERTKNVTFNVPLRGGLGNRARGQFVQDPATYGVTFRTRF